jgi:hypothetical protein
VLSGVAGDGDRFQKTLDTFKVPAKEQQELIIIVGSTKKDIAAPATSQR